MKNVFLTCSLLFSAILLSQNIGSIKGTVTDKTMSNEPLLFANVQLLGSSISYQTNFHGSFEISDIELGEHTLRISYAGYQTEEIVVLISENTITQIETILSPMQLSFADVVGMETSSKEETTAHTNTEKGLRK